MPLCRPFSLFYGPLTVCQTVLYVVPQAMWRAILIGESHE